MKLLTLLTLLLSPLAFAYADCGNVFSVKIGPYDYANADDRRYKLGVVERRHFTDRVASLQGGETGSIMADLSYTLRQFPNHYPALMSLVRYSEYETVKSNPELQEEINCFFRRSIQFKPSDYRVYQIYGIYLFGKGDYKGSVENYSKSLSLQDSAEVHYNIGLAYLKLGDVRKAEIHAKKAYEKGYPLPGLKNLLLNNDLSIEQ